MPEPKFDLNRMRQEIEEDEKVVPQSTKPISQDEIRARVMRKRKESKHGR